MYQASHFKCCVHPKKMLLDCNCFRVLITMSFSVLLFNCWKLCHKFKSKVQFKVSQRFFFTNFSISSHHNILLLFAFEVVAQNLLHTFTCLIPFLTHEDMDQLPYLLANSIAVIPPNLHKDLLDILCYNLLPFTIRNPPYRPNSSSAPTTNLNAGHQHHQQHHGIDDWHLENYANVSIPTILMMVFFYTDIPTYNTQLLETLMQLKRKIVKNLY